MITVELPNLTLTNEPGQIIEKLADLVGWFDGVGLDSKRVQRPRADGLFGKRRTYKTGRFVNVFGEIAAVGSDVFELQERVMALQSVVGQFELAVTSPRGRRTARVELADAPSFAISQENGVASFEIPLLARDPRKYGAVVQAGPAGLPRGGIGIASPISSPLEMGDPGDSGQVVTWNAGQADTWSEIEVTGGLAGGFEASCVETGDLIRFERPIPLGSTVRVDLRSMRAHLDEVNDVTIYLTRKEGWSVPRRGGTRTIQFNAIGAATGTPTLTAFTAPADL